MGFTALHFAADRGHDTTCAVLLEKGASRNVKDRRGRTAAELASDPAVRAIFEALAAPEKGAG